MYGDKIRIAKRQHYTDSSKFEVWTIPLSNIAIKILSFQSRKPNLFHSFCTEFLLGEEKQSHVPNLRDKAMNAMARGGQWLLALAILARMHHEMLERDGGGEALGSRVELTSWRFFLI